MPQLAGCERKRAPQSRDRCALPRPIWPRGPDRRGGHHSSARGVCGSQPGAPAASRLTAPCAHPVTFFPSTYLLLSCLGVFVHPVLPTWHRPPAHPKSRALLVLPEPLPPRQLHALRQPPRHGLSRPAPPCWLWFSQALVSWRSPSPLPVSHGALQRRSLVNGH